MKRCTSKYVIRVRGKLRLPASKKVAKSSLRIRVALRFVRVAIILATIFLSLFLALTIESKYLSAPYAPDDRTMNEINRLVRVFGFGNESVIIVVRNNYERRVEWVGALTGLKTYAGNVVYLISNKTDEDPIITTRLDVVNSSASIGSLNGLKKSGVFQDPLKYTIILSECLSQPDRVELGFLTEIQEGIYVVRQMTHEEALMWVYVWESQNTL